MTFEEGVKMRAHTRKIVTLTCAVAALVVSSAALAVTGGTPVSTPFVGAAVQMQVQGGTPGFELCSGFLISPTSFVTAAHCFDPTGAPIHITFGSNADPGAPLTASVSATLDDIAVLTLSQPVVLDRYAVLPALGLSTSVSSVDIVGYGVQGFTPKKIPIAFGFKTGVTTPVKSAGNLSDIYLKLLASPGACFGDSGGPNFVSGSNTVVAITSGGLKSCQGISYAERIDTTANLAFLTPFATS